MKQNEMRAEGFFLYHSFMPYYRNMHKGHEDSLCMWNGLPRETGMSYSLKIVENMIWNSMRGDKMLFIPIHASGVELAANSKTFTRQQERFKKYSICITGLWQESSLCPNWIIEISLGINVEHVLSKCLLFLLFSP